MEGGSRGRQAAPCNPSVILLTMCLLSWVIGWQMGNRHGAELARTPPCPPVEDNTADSVTPAGLDASTDLVRFFRLVCGRAAEVDCKRRGPQG